MPQSSNKKIAKNTLVLYFRMILTMVVTMYTSRVVLSTLGVEDYGIYNVVGGFVSMFLVLNTSLSSATSRFLIYELGRKDYAELKRVFNAALVGHLGIALMIFLIAETVGLWFLANKLVIPPERLAAAHWAYQFSILATMVTLTQVPYTALIIAHEKMNIYAYMSFLEVTLKLVIVYLLKVGSFDKLKMYAILHFLVVLVTALAYRFYCNRKYPEASLCVVKDKSVYKRLISFSVWELYGGFGVISMGQGTNILLNMFFGPAVNAARGVAVTLQGAINKFSQSFMTAVKPQIVKLYADEQVDKMLRLVYLSAKFSFFLNFFFTLPLLLETDFVLTVWLKNPPEYAAVFCKLILINNLILSMANPFVYAFHAVGNIRRTNLVCGSLFYLVILLSFLLFRIGYPPETAFVVTIGVTALVNMVRLQLLKAFLPIKLIEYFKQVLVPVGLVVFLSTVFPLILVTVVEPGFLRFLIVGSVCVVGIGLSVYYIGLERDMRKFVMKQALKNCIFPRRRLHKRGFK